MSAILLQFILTFNLVFGTNGTELQSVNRTGIEIVPSVVIIDTDEL